MKNRKKEKSSGTLGAIGLMFLVGGIFTLPFGAVGIVLGIILIFVSGRNKEDKIFIKENIKFKKNRSQLKWQCDNCRKRFGTRKKAEEHEKNCKFRKK